MRLPRLLLDLGAEANFVRSSPIQQVQDQLDRSGKRQERASDRHEDALLPIELL